MACERTSGVELLLGEKISLLFGSLAAMPPNHWLSSWCKAMVHSISLRAVLACAALHRQSQGARHSDDHPV